MGSVALNFVGGIPFQGLYEVVKVALHKSIKFKTHLINLEFTLRCIHSPTLEEIRDNYVRLNLLTDTVVDLKQKVIVGKRRVGELSELSMWNIRIWGNCCNCIGHDYAKELDELDRSLWSLLELLQLEQMRNMTELLCLARDARDKQDDLEKKQDEVLTGVQELGKKVDELLATVKEQQDQIQRIIPNSVQQVPSSSGGQAGDTALGVVFRQLVDAVVQVKVENMMFKRLLKTFKSTLYCLQPLIEEIAEHGRVVHLPKQEVEKLTIQIENGVEYVLKWSKVSKHANYKKYKYTNQILSLDESLQRLFIELKGQVERNVKEAMASASKIEMAIQKIEAEGLCDVQLPELPSPAVGFDKLNMQGQRDVTEETLSNSASVKEETEGSSDVPPELPSPADVYVVNMQGSMDVKKLNLITTNIEVVVTETEGVEVVDDSTRNVQETTNLLDEESGDSKAEVLQAFKEETEKDDKYSKKKYKDVAHAAQAAFESAAARAAVKLSSSKTHDSDDHSGELEKVTLDKPMNIIKAGEVEQIECGIAIAEPLSSSPAVGLTSASTTNIKVRRLKQSEDKKGWSMLQLINLSDSQYLMPTPDFTGVPHLEELVLQNCTNLVEVHPSFGFLKKLRYLNMENCKSIESIPPFTTLESLQILRLSFCSGLKKFPEIEGNMKSLLELHLDGTSIEELPQSIECLTGLTMLNLADCKNLLHLPNTIGCLTSLKSLYLTGCSKIVEIPENLNGLKYLETLAIGGTSIRELSFIVGMKNLQYLSCRGCQCLVSESCKGLASLSNLIQLDLSYCNLMDGAILNDFSSLISLRLLDLSGNCFVRLPESISQLSKLETLHLSNCRQLQLLPMKLPLSLQNVYAEECTSLTDYPNQIKVLNSRELGVTIVNSSALGVSQSSAPWALSKNEGESIELRVIHKHAEGKQVDHLPLATLPYRKLPFWSNFSTVLPTDEIPEWFSTLSTRNPISISIPQNLADDNKWKGFAACAIFSVKGHTALSVVEPDPDFLNYSYQMTLETDVVRLEPFVLGVEVACLGSSSHLLMIFYISSLEFSLRMLKQSTVIRAIFETTNPSMVVQKCAIRLVYEQDAGWHSRIFGAEDDPICLNEVEDAASVLESDWLSQSLKWETFIPPLEEESTLVPRKNLESVLPRYLEALNYESVMYTFNLRGSPGWFHESFASNTRSASTIVSIKLPQNLHKSKKLMGFAIYASLVEEVGQTIKEENYRVFVTLTTGDKSSMSLFRELEHVRPLSEEHHQLLVTYIPRAQIPEVLFTQTLKTAMDFYIDISDSPHVKVQGCGLRIVYQEDIQGFADTIIRCMQREDSLKSNDKFAVEKWIQLIRLQGAHLERMTERDSRTPREKYYELQSRKYRDWDWSDPRSAYCVFKRVEISKLKWFMPFINQGNSAEIQLPLNVFDDDNWLGFAACFQLSDNQYPNISLGSTAPDSEDVMLSGRLDSDVAWQRLFDFEMHLRLKSRETLEYDATWFFYIQRTRVRSKVWRQCKLARMTIGFPSPISPCLTVHSSALRLLFKEDVEHLVETLILAELP